MPKFLSTTIKVMIGFMLCLTLNTATPAFSDTETRQEPTLSLFDRQQIQCMALNNYFEARNQSTIGMVAVSHVVINRTRSARFPHTPCGVINQRSGRGCQFTWVCAGAHRISEPEAYVHCQEVAQRVYRGIVNDVTNGATYYHTRNTRPAWTRTFAVTARIGDHIFYRG